MSKTSARSTDRRGTALLVLGLAALVAAVVYHPQPEPATPPERGWSIDLDVDYGGSADELIRRAEAIVVAHPKGPERTGFEFADQPGLAQYVQDFVVVDSLRGALENGDTISVARLDLTDAGRESGVVLEDPVLPAFEAGREYVLLLTGVPGDPGAPWHIAGYLGGALTKEDDVLNPTFVGDEDPPVVGEFRGMPWEDFEGKAAEPSDHGGSG